MVKAILTSLGVAVGVVLLVGAFTLTLNMVSTPDTLTASLGSFILIAAAAFVGQRAYIWLKSNALDDQTKATCQPQENTARPANRGKDPFLVLIALMLGSAGCVGCTRVEPGYEGIKVNMVGSERGVDSMPIVTGRVFYNPITHEVYEFPTFVQRVIWTAARTEGSTNDDSFTFRSTEGYAFNVDVGFGFSFLPGRTPHLFEKYRTTPEQIIDGPFRDIVREAYVQSGSRMEGLNILGPGVTTLNETATALVQAKLEQQVLVEYVNIIGQPRVDSRVEESINAVIQATQRANEAEETVRQKEFEAQQRVAEATGRAEAMRIEAIAKAEAIRIEAEALRKAGAAVIDMRSIEKWNGIMPQVVGGGAVPFINVPTSKK